MSRDAEPGVEDAIPFLVERRPKPKRKRLDTREAGLREAARMMRWWVRNNEKMLKINAAHDARLQITERMKAFASAAKVLLQRARAESRRGGE